MKPAGLCLVLLWCFPALTFAADELRVAVAANFLPTLSELSESYQQSSTGKILVSSGSSGKLYAQIINGAPYDLFFSADEQRPLLLEKAGIGVTGSRFSYALGRLAMWSPAPGVLSPQAPHFELSKIRFFAIANPNLAPYGRAAQETLQQLGVWEQLQMRLVRGENINQAYHYVRSGNAELGLIALAQLQQAGQLEHGSTWLVPATLHTPILQQALVLSDRPDALAFAAFIQSPAGTDIIRRHGYDIPELPE